MNRVNSDALVWHDMNQTLGKPTGDLRVNNVFERENAFS
jgi:hypothetical protein